MCGILGLSFLGRREDAVEAVERGLATIIHRGPDDRGLIAVAGVAAALRALLVRIEVLAARYDVGRFAA